MKIERVAERQEAAMVLKYINITLKVKRSATHQEFVDSFRDGNNEISLLRKDLSTSIKVVPSE